MGDSLFELIDEIREGQKQAEAQAREDREEILEAIRKANAVPAVPDPVRREVDRRNFAFSLKNFIRRSVHEYVWLGMAGEFEKKKTEAFRWLVAAVGGVLACTVVTTVSCGFYTTFTLFENIWLILLFFVMSYTHAAKCLYPTGEYSMNSFFHFEVDADGVLRSTVYKNRYKWGFLLSCLASLGNAIGVWVMGGSVPLLAMLLELGSLSLNITAVYKVTDLFAGYAFLRFTGMNEAGTAKVSLIFDPILNELHIEEDYLKKFPLISWK